MAEPVLRTVKFGEWKVGDSFDSFAEFQQRIQALQDATAVQLYRREGKTLAASMQRYPGRAGQAKPELRYYLLNYCCVYMSKNECVMVLYMIHTGDLL